MAVFDAHKNLAVSLVATAPVTPTAGTSLAVTATQGARFGTPPFNATVCPAGTAPDPSNGEIIRITAGPPGSDTFTIVRAQEGTTARSIVVGDQIFADVSAKVFTDIETPLQSLIVNPLTGWYDMNRQVNPVLPANTAATNITNNNAIMAAAPTGSTLYYAGGVYAWNAAWTMPAAKTFNFIGQGNGATGANTIFEWTSNVGGDIIVLPNTFWYWTFQNLTFGTSVNQTAGALLNINGNAGISIQNCTVAGIFGGTWNNVFNGPSVGTRGNATTDQSWNSSLISNTQISSYKGIGVNIDSSSCSLVISDNCVIQGAWGGFGAGTPSTLQALAGVQTSACGALQINDCDVLGNVNNLLLSPVPGQVTASVFSTNTYYDNSGGSCIKIAGAGATVRCRFDTCSFTTAGTNYATAGTALSAFEIAGTFAFTATAGQGINLINCNILNTFGTTGTTNAMLVTNAADFSVAYCNVAAYTNGLNVTPIAALNVTKFNFTNNTCGTSGGYNGVTTGVLINAGSAFRGYTIVGNDFSGCTLAINDGGSVSTQGGVKVISQNNGMWGGRAASNAAQSITTTATLITGAQVWLPKGGALVNGTYKATLVFSQAALGNPTVSLRFGPNGTTADATLVTITPTIAAAAGCKVELYFTVTGSIGATATTRCTAQNFVTGVVPTTINQLTAAIATPTVNTTVDNWLTIAASISASTLVVLYAAIEPVTQPD